MQVHVIISEVINNAPASNLPPLATETADEFAIEARELSFRYGEREALRNVSFTIRRGEIFGFLGPNGGGKTTLFRLLSTLSPAQPGRLKVLGHDLSNHTRALRRQIGVVFQHPSLDGKLTATENLHYHGRLYGLSGRILARRSIEMLDRLGMSNRAGDLAEILSGGQKRRVELAKALLHRPALLLLDEPSTGLDPGARREFDDYLANLRQRDGLTVVMTTHYMEEAERCDRIGLLDEGALIAIASPGELKQQIGGDVVVVRPAATANGLVSRLNQRFGVNGKLVGGTIRIERLRGHELVSEIVEIFGNQVESVTFGKPTLEDAFIHLTGRQFFSDSRQES